MMIPSPTAQAVTIPGIAIAGPGGQLLLPGMGLMNRWNAYTPPTPTITPHTKRRSMLLVSYLGRVHHSQASTPAAMAPVTRAPLAAVSGPELSPVLMPKADWLIVVPVGWFAADGSDPVAPPYPEEPIPRLSPAMGSDLRQTLDQGPR